MADMTFDEFKQEIADNIKEYLPDKYADSIVQVNAVQKNNETLDALTITSPDSNMSPTIYLNSFYEDYQKIQLVLGDNAKSDDSLKFILDEKVVAKNIFKGNVEDVIDLPEKRYSINKVAFGNINSYKEIL